MTKEQGSGGSHADEPASKAEPAPKAEPTPTLGVKPASKAEPAPKAEPTPTLGVEPTSKAEPTPTPKAEPTPTPTPKAEPTPTLDVKPTPKAEPTPTPALDVKPAPHSTPTLTGAPWARAIARFDAWWTTQEVRLVTVVLVAEILALCLWIALKALSTEYDGHNLLGMLFRAAACAVVVGLGVHFATHKRVRRNAPFVLAGIAVGFVLGRSFANVGVGYFSNVLNWVQSASAVTLVGGLRSPGLVTRLTLWVALLGASIATAQGKHINVDVVMRFLAPRLRMPVAVLGWTVAAVVCLGGVWGFFDTIAIEGFKSNLTEPCANDPSKECAVGVKSTVFHVGHAMKRDSFLLGRQLSLDATTVPRVVAGKKYNDYLHAPEWNAWLKGAAWTDYFAAEDVNGQLMDESDAVATRQPVINVPGSGEDVNGLLIRDLNLVFPFGLLMIGLRFILRALLAIGGVVKVDPDAQYAEEESPPQPGAKPAETES